ncbi:PstS family phosphate ABC transporter substrate-binding protein [Alkalihalobacterium chitinilyticum]|uniref:Phosphate-binding protein n=1 Tax=Alkalihalobacterium chitinilyticum TaxID=2980103 RepID=A0ABT5VAU6_9BACI|nr:PstS family phosphate ABC transporter substrate-binding protein [Alkalihalobacterium chitinilyticum]MDE5412472.1 PstS family phosphate ABC transporter substrate-binding protein [Alkalihalobacterium chitinilyticum]
MKFFKRSALTLGMASMMLFATACGSSGSNTETGGSSSNDSNNNDAEPKQEQVDELSGSVLIDGSGTVYPLMARLAEEFMLNEQEKVSVEVSRAGTSAGMKKYVVGETDLSNASRGIKDEELAELEANNIESKEFKVALDGLTMVIHPENDWAGEMTEEEIKTMFVTGNIKEDDVVMWSDIRSEWPEEQINFYGPNENHGTNEFFVDVIIEKQDLVKTINLQQEYSTLVSLVSEDKNAIAFFGYGYYANNTDKIKAVAVDFGNGPVAPSLDTIKEDGEYGPFTRPVFTNLSINAAKEKAQVKAFAEYIFTAANDFAGETGFAPLPEEELKANLEFVQSIK